MDISSRTHILHGQYTVQEMKSRKKVNWAKYTPVFSEFIEKNSNFRQFLSRFISEKGNMKFKETQMRGLDISDLFDPLDCGDLGGVKNQEGQFLDEIMATKIRRKVMNMYNASYSNPLSQKEDLSLLSDLGSQQIDSTSAEFGPGSTTSDRALMTQHGHISALIGQISQPEAENHLPGSFVRDKSSDNDNVEIDHLLYIPNPAFIPLLSQANNIPSSMASQNTSHPQQSQSNEVQASRVGSGRRLSDHRHFQHQARIKKIDTWSNSKILNSGSSAGVQQKKKQSSVADLSRSNSTPHGRTGHGVCSLLTETQLQHKRYMTDDGGNPIDYRSNVSSTTPSLGIAPQRFPSPIPKYLSQPTNAGRSNQSHSPLPIRMRSTSLDGTEGSYASKVQARDGNLPTAEIPRLQLEFTSEMDKSLHSYVSDDKDDHEHYHGDRFTLTTSASHDSSVSSASSKRKSTQLRVNTSPYLATHSNTSWPVQCGSANLARNTTEQHELLSSRSLYPSLPKPPLRQSSPTEEQRLSFSGDNTMYTSGGWTSIEHEQHKQQHQRQQQRRIAPSSGEMRNPTSYPTSKTHSFPLKSPNPSPAPPQASLDMDSIDPVPKLLPELIDHFAAHIEYTYCLAVQQAHEMHNTEMRCIDGLEALAFTVESGKHWKHKGPRNKVGEGVGGDDTGKKFNDQGEQKENGAEKIRHRERRKHQKWKGKGREA